MTSVLDFPVVPAPRVAEPIVRAGDDCFGYLEITDESGTIRVRSNQLAAMALNLSGAELARGMASEDIARCITRSVRSWGMEHIEMLNERNVQINRRRMGGTVTRNESSEQRRIWTVRRAQLCVDLAFSLSIRHGGAV
jgi:hypothetical protein